MKNNTKINDQAWSHYWTGPASLGATCVPGAPAEVTDLLERIWQQFFGRLPSDSEVLDLGTGSGTVLQSAKQVRSDLNLTGVDYSQSLPDGGDGITLLPGVFLEDLPFAENSFTAVTAQFALEYGDWPAAVDELKRVLADDGSLQLICHHSKGIIVAANRERLAALEDILSGSGLFNGSLKIVRQRKIREPKSGRYLDRLLNKLHAAHPQQPVVSEVVQRIADLMTQPAALKKLMSLRRDIEMEQQRIKALLAAALTPARARELQQMLVPSTALINCNTLYLPGTETPLAWLISSSTE